MTVDFSLLTLAVHDSYTHHNKQDEVKEFKKHEKENIEELYLALQGGTWQRFISFRRGEVTNTNGKHRYLFIPSLRTRILEHYFLLIVIPLYQEANRGVGLARNCQPGYGITAKVKEHSVLHEVKNLMYDLREFHLILTLDQRQCYAHVHAKIYRKAMKFMFKRLGMEVDKHLIDFGEIVSFAPNGQLPIGTPTSPWIHHIIMLMSDIFIHDNTEWCLRYADDNIIAFRDAKELNTMKWRIANFWWYEYGMRVKRSSIRIIDIDKSTIDFCSYIVHRNKDKGVADNNKGYTVIRHSTLRHAKETTEAAWPSYFGMLKWADCWKVITKIQASMPKAADLTAKVQINREFDAPNKTMKDLEGVVHNVYDYYMLNDKNGHPNWIKALIGIWEDTEKVNKETKEKYIVKEEHAYEYHGNLHGIIDWFVELEKRFGVKGFLPLEEGEIINQCGYIYKGSVNQIKMIDHGLLIREDGTIEKKIA